MKAGTQRYGPSPRASLDILRGLQIEHWEDGERKKLGTSIKRMVPAWEEFEKSKKAT
jgi:hypothetical protein